MTQISITTWSNYLLKSQLNNLNEKPEQCLHCPGFFLHRVEKRLKDEIIGFLLFLCGYFLVIYSSTYLLVSFNFLTIGWSTGEMWQMLRTSVEGKVLVISLGTLVILSFYLTPWHLPSSKGSLKQ